MGLQSEVGVFNDVAVKNSLTRTDIEQFAAAMEALGAARFGIPVNREDLLKRVAIYYWDAAHLDRVIGELMERDGLEINGNQIAMKKPK
jgi:hypothetical protein